VQHGREVSMVSRDRPGVAGTGAAASHGNAGINLISVAVGRDGVRKPATRYRSDFRC
jgi:hypothetical protein